MSEKDFNIYISIESNKLSVAIFSIFNEKNIFFKEYDCTTYLNDDQLNFKNLDKILEKNIFEVEKVTNKYLNEVVIIVDSIDSLSLDLSRSRDIENKKIYKKDAQYLIQDTRQLILRSYPDKSILHIVVDNYMIDDINYKQLPIDINCKKFSIDMKFICISKNLIKKLEATFNLHEITISKIISSNYAKSFFKNEVNYNICEMGFKLNRGKNKQEVVIIPKKIQKKGFFERLFHLFE
tara:strand:+ start:1449 stop:2159 length:711 start_codon:yes stop_codon:yes gene_type:complete